MVKARLSEAKNSFEAVVNRLDQLASELDTFLVNTTLENFTLRKVN